jgi:glucokinase
MVTVARAFVGIDIGGTTTDAVVVDPEMNVSGAASHATGELDGDAVLVRAIEVARAALGGLETTPDVVEGIGVGVPGLVDTDSGWVRLATNINIGEEGFPIGPKIEAEFGVPTTVENDVRAAALAAFEHFRASDGSLRSLALIGVGTGISAGLILDGLIYRGRNGLAGEIGHVPVVQNGPQCSCGLRGCLEAVAAGPAISRRWPTGSGHPARELFRAAAAGDANAIATVAMVTGHIARAVHLVGSAYDPDLIVLGGGVGAVGEPLLSAVRSSIADLARRSPLVRYTLPPERVVAVPTGLSIGAIGAAAVARQRFGGDGGGVRSTEGRAP